MDANTMDESKIIIINIKLRFLNIFFPFGFAQDFYIFPTKLANHE